LRDQRHAIGALEGRPQGQEFVERDSQRVNVAAGVALSLKSLGRHVANRANDVSGPRQPIFLRLRQAEVGDPHDAAGVEQEVRRLDVAVNDSPFVGVGQCRRDLPADAGDAHEVMLAVRLDC